MKTLFLILFLCASTQAASINPQEITSDHNSIIVPESWMQDYKRLGDKYGTIRDDSRIRREKNKYHIPIAVAKHYLKLAQKEQR